jgi:hypothetical protein
MRITGWKTTLFILFWGIFRTSSYSVTVISVRNVERTEFQATESESKLVQALQFMQGVLRKQIAMRICSSSDGVMRLCNANLLKRPSSPNQQSLESPTPEHANQVPS